MVKLEQQGEHKMRILKLVCLLGSLAEKLCQHLEDEFLKHEINDRPFQEKYCIESKEQIKGQKLHTK